MSIEGAADTQVFDAYVEKSLLPTLLPGDILLLDLVKFRYAVDQLDRGSRSKCQTYPSLFSGFQPDRGVDFKDRRSVT